jgi:hypothetical protein
MKTKLGPNVMLKLLANAVMLPQWLITGDDHFEASRYESSWLVAPSWGSSSQPLPPPFSLLRLVKNVVEPSLVQPTRCAAGRPANLAPNTWSSPRLERVVGDSTIQIY